MKKENRYNIGAPEIRSVTDEDGNETRTVEGYALLFDTPSKLLGGENGFVEVIDKRALEGADMGDVIARTEHENRYVLARTSAGTLSLTADATGLKYSFEAPNTTAGNDLAENLRNGNITASSFAFSVNEDKWEKRDGVNYRTLTSISKIYDVAPVVEPAYPDTDVAIRSLEDFKGEDKIESRHKNLALTIKIMEME